MFPFNPASPHIVLSVKIDLELKCASKASEIGPPYRFKDR
jgi:hypothetical protein